MTQETTAPEKPQTEESRDEKATKLVERFSLWGAGAGLIPVPGLDIVSVGGVQLQMLRRLSEIYGVPFSENLGKAVIASLMGALVPGSAAMGVGSVLKFVPGVNAVVSLTTSGLSAGATFVIGKVFIQHFASGGTLLDFNPPDYRGFIKAQRDRLTNRSASAAPPPAAPPPAAVRSAPSKTVT
jgi:uncharacterized protein (DUF697 family)